MGDRVQFAAPDKELQTANRELATIECLNGQGVWTNIVIWITAMP